MKPSVKSQNIRKPMILISFLLFPITLYYFSPYLIIEGIAQGILTGSFFVFAGMLVASIFFGRLFCGWLCHAGALQEACSLVNNHRNKGKRRKWIKYIIWVPWVLAIAALGISILKFFHLPGLHLHTEPTKYIRCNECTKKFIMSLDVMKLVKAGDITDLDWALCGECVDLCPQNVITYRMK